ncbi:sugar phosphate isomerase/epimerase family protein [Saliterribacillus persicus]|uniref:Sugar phosphate isomerase/epimerase n=1 Tax=Saliterribacillus persicus TaxID=930114 RepID=A0A368Y7X5_9BACI|nr:sugar phosphate isomerase/epimerase family protein [Saliterribacillus persicus]RCW74927.1 sugar phosphate isomerase/epimerase [Saliterribacillus persicus]
MKVLMSSTLAWAYPIPGVIKLADIFGLDGVEIWTEQIYFHHTPLQAIQDAVKSSNQMLTMHAPSWDINIAALNKGIRMQSLAEIEKTIEIAKAIGADNVTFHPGRLIHENCWHKKQEQFMVESLYQLAEKAASKNIEISLELMEEKPKELITTPDAMNRLLEKIPENIRVTFDVAHVPVDINPFTYFQSLQRINKIHLSDATRKNYHVPIGTGEIDLPDMIEACENTDLPTVIEGFDQQTGLKLLKQNIDALKAMRSRRETVENISYK